MSLHPRRLVWAWLNLTPCRWLRQPAVPVNGTRPIKQVSLDDADWLNETVLHPTAKSGIVELRDVRACVRACGGLAPVRRFERVGSDSHSRCSWIQANPGDLDLIRVMTPMAGAVGIPSTMHWFQHDRVVNDAPLIVCAGFDGTGLASLARALEVMGTSHIALALHPHTHTHTHLPRAPPHFRH